MAARDLDRKGCVRGTTQRPALHLCPESGFTTPRPLEFPMSKTVLITGATSGFGSAAVR
ncbi:NADP-dependent 3-hydroxy acid dehydrogenase, partial [Xanthomonas oryzae pv. oryzae]